MASFHRLPCAPLNRAQWWRGSRLYASDATLRSHGGVNVGHLAGAIKAPLSRGETCAVDAVGPAALLKALKAMIFASDYLQEQRPGFRVAGEPRLESVPASAEQPETTKLRMHLSLVPEPPFRSAAVDLTFGKGTNPGIAAATLAQKIKLQGPTTVSAMGALPASKALKSVIIAQRYLHEHLGEDVLLVVPAKQVLKEGRGVGDEEVVRLLLALLPGQSQR
ncbi:unnamed protein product [Symbiodinium sp. CCMP2456]|nr:unnamed protein product [Symbiodinium sp. CCMP2456]